MSEAEQRSQAVSRWMNYAWMDLEAARVDLEHGVAASIVCFHAQQTAEKAIKACYVWLNAEFPFIHHLDRLRNELPGEWPLKALFPDLSLLTFWAADGRYPGDWPEATNEEAEEALSLAEKVFEQVLHELKKRGYVEIR